MPIALFLITDAWLQKPDPRVRENRPRSQWGRLRAVSSRQGLGRVIPQQVVPNAFGGLWSAWAVWPSKAPPKTHSRQNRAGRHFASD